MALRIEFLPTASHCIETVAKREYWKNVDTYLKNRKHDEDIERRIELLRAFLETASFAKLRKELEEHLENGKQVIFTLYLKNSKPCYEITQKREHENMMEKNLVIKPLK